MSTKKAVFIFPLVAIIVSAIFYLISRTTHSGDFIKEVELNGDTVKISGYTMPENLRLNLVYEPREDLNSYSWLKPLLFSCANGFYLSIPESEWGQYYEGPVIKKRDLEEYQVNLAEMIRNENRTGYYNEISMVVECNIDGQRYLSFCLKEKDAKGNSTGNSVYQMLKNVDGKWKLVVDSNENAAKRIQQIADSYDLASGFIADGSLQTKPARKL